MVTTADIPPGGEGKIDVTINTHGRRGKLEKQVDVFSNDPEKPKFQLKISGLVELVADFDPNRVNLKNVLKGATATETVKVVAKDLSKIQLTELVVSDPVSLKAEIVKAEAGPAVKVTFIAGDKERHFSGRVTAKTNLEKPKEIEFFVYGAVTADLTPEPAFAFFDPFDEKNPPTFKVKLSSLSGKPFKVLGLKDPDGFVVGAIEHKDKDWLVTLKLAKEPKPPRGKVQILTDRKDQESIEVAYTVRMAGMPPGPPGPPGPGMPVMMPRRIEMMKPPGPGTQPMQAHPQFKRMPPPGAMPVPQEPPKQ